MSRDFRGLRVLNIAATTGPTTLLISTNRLRLCGWSLSASDATGLEATNTQVAPLAATTIATLPNTPAGEYTVKWQVELVGPAAAADQNNFRLFVGGNVVATSLNQGAAGNYIQSDVNIVVPAGGASVRIQNIGAGTAAVTYGASLTLTQAVTAEGSFVSAGHTLGVFSAAPSAVDKIFVSEEGIYVPNDLAMVLNSGTVSGCVYVRMAEKYDELAK